MADGSILGIIQRKNPEKEFDIAKQIGSGTYGEVYEAKVIKTGDKVALKIIKIEPGEDFNIIQQEIAILADCKHPNIVGYSGSYLRRDRLWIAMEFCGGGSLQDIYHAISGGLNELQIAFVCREILKGLQYLHERNKIHRDIKGANILLTNSGEVKLADFGIAAQLTQTLLMKRKSFIGTPYWMAPEVAAVERKGGYNQQCDIWAVGITAVELAETQPPMFDLHPMRALYLMTKRNFKSPALQHKNKWSENFHEFLKYALQKEPKKRPAAQELLRHEFVNRNALCSALMLPLITVLEAPVPKPKHPVDEDTEEELDDNPHDSENKRKNFKRISSVKNQAKIGKQLSEADMNLVPPHQDLSWVEDPNYRPGIQKLETIHNEEPSNHKAINDDYTDPDLSPNSPPPYSQLSAPANAPPVPPRAKEDNTTSPSPVSDGIYGNVVDHPPVPPRQKSNPPVQTGPPLPPKQPTQPRPTKRKPKGSESDRRAYFSKIFNGCPLHLTCAASWTHPLTKAQYALLGAEEGLFSLLILPNNPDPVMEQVSSRACHWLKIVENSLVWLSGHSRFVSTSNLLILFQTESQKQSLQQSYGRNRQSIHTAKIPDSRNCTKCCISRNPFTDQRYLIAVVPKGILLMQWYQPQYAFKLVMLFEYTPPSPLTTLEAFVHQEEEYPIICFGIKEGNDGRLIFDTMNLNTQASWYTDAQPEGRNVNVLCLQQLERDTFFIGIDRCAKFVDKEGQLKPSEVQAAQLTFDRKSEHMVYLSNCVLSFHKHGMQGKSLQTQQVTAEVADGTKVFHLIGSHGNIIIETRPLHDPNSPSNIYILVSEDQAQQ